MSKARHATRVQIAAAAVAVVTAATGAVTLVSADATASTTTATTSPTKAAAGWLSRQLTGSKHDHYAVTFNGKQFPDAGETIDGLLALDAAKVASGPAARITSWLKANAKDYATGSGFTTGYNPGSLAKLLLAAEAQHANEHSFGGIDLVHALRIEEQSNGAFLNTSDTSGFGESPIDQALALIALSHTGSLYDWPNANAIAWLVGQQCGDGGFTAATQTTPAKTCTDVDATSYAAQALLTVHSSAAARALHWLSAHVNRDGGFGLSNGKPSSNANSTALALQAEAAAGHSALVAKAYNWLRGHQVGCSAAASHRGAVVFAGKTYSQATALRATTQAGQALAKRWLGTINNTKAVDQTPVEKC